MRDKRRLLAPGLAATLALAAAAVTVGVLAPGHGRHHGGGLASGTSSSATRSPASHVKPGMLTRGPAPGLGVSRSGQFSVPVSLLAAQSAGVAPLRTLRPADVLVVAPRALPPGAVAAVRRLHGVTAAEAVDGARVKVDGKFAAVLGVDPSQFRSFAARPTAASDPLWQRVAAGQIAVSYTMGKLDRLPLGGPVVIAGARRRQVRVGGFGTVGITGVDAVVSDAVARSLGFPAGNVIVVSAPHANLATLTRQISRLVPRDAVTGALVSQDVRAGSAGMISVSARSVDGYPTLSTAQLTTMLKAALSRLGKPYVWGGAGPDVFDCSGLVQWSFAQAGIVMPRVAADQALTGPAVPLSQAAPGDLLFYHTDPTAPNYISHVAIYLGHGLMIQAPEPGLDVQVVPVALGAGFAGMVRVDPAIAAKVAASSVS